MRLCSTFYAKLREFKFFNKLTLKASDEWSTLPPEVVIDDTMGNTVNKNGLNGEFVWENKWAENTTDILENPMYKYLDIHGGGILIERYEKEGVKSVLKIIREEIGMFLYKDGQGLELNGLELADRPSSKYQVPNDGSSEDSARTIMTSLSDSSNKSVKNMLPVPKNAPTKVTDDKRMYTSLSKVYNKSQILLVCWDISKRGIFGETLLHLCFVCNTPAHRHIAKLMLSMFPNLAKDIFIGWEYFGQSALHMAIINKDFEMVKLLIHYGSDISRRAIGDFFMPDDQRRSKRAKISDFGGPSYYGEYPSCFAACSGSAEIYDFLINCGADPNDTDLYGNNVLHMLVIHNRVEIYRFALRHHKKPADHKALNCYGLSPVSLSAKLGHRDIFNEIIDLSATEIWKFSNIACKIYPLKGVDTIGPSGRTDWDSAFMHIINGTTEGHLDMLEEGVISQLLSEKWHKYAKARFFQRLILLAAHLTILSLAIYLRPVMYSALYTGAAAALSNVTLTTAASTTTDTSVSTQDVFRYIFETISVFNSFLTLCLHFDEVREQGVIDFIKGLRHAPPKAFFLIACFLISLALPARLASIFWTAEVLRMQIIEETLLIIALPCVWFYLLFFAGGTQLNGTFVTMIYKMIRGDILRFGIIYLIVLICFAQAYYFLFQDIEQKSINSFREPLVTVMTLFQMTLGEFKMSKGQFLIKYDEFNYARYQHLAKLVFAMFMILMPILLLNMLIAMMGNTYQQVTARASKEWISMYAKIVIILERSYSPKQLLQFQSEYATPLPGNDNDVGLMVIYRAKKTLAKQRHTATNNWKRSCRKVMSLIRGHKGLGNAKPFSFDGSDESLITIRQQKAKLINFQKRASQTQRMGTVLKKIEMSAYTKSLDAIGDQHIESMKLTENLETSIDEILNSVPDIADSDTLELDSPSEKTTKVNPLTNSAFRLLINNSPKRVVPTSAKRNPPLSNVNQSSFNKSMDSSDDNPLLPGESHDNRGILRRTSTQERSDSSGSVKTVTTNLNSPPNDSSSQDSDPQRTLINLEDLASPIRRPTSQKRKIVHTPKGKGK